MHDFKTGIQRQICEIKSLWFTEYKKYKNVELNKINCEFDPV